MTLQRQILWLLNISFLVVVLVVFSVQFNTSRDSIDRQMETDVQNASTALGLTLTAFLDKQDRGAVDTVLQAVFDAGFYSEIRLDWYAKGEVIAKKQEPRAVDVPNWFMNLPLFEAVSQEQVVTSGWLQVANLTVVGNPAVAYQALWRTGVQLLATLSLVYFILLLTVWRGLRLVMKPLHAIVVQARRITKRQFGNPISEPRTRELKTVVMAINEMTDRVKLMFEGQDEQIGRLRLATQTDPVSGLSNRTHLLSHISAWLSEPGTGGLMLMDIKWLDALRLQQGYKARDDLIKALAERFKSLCVKGSRCVFARISHTEFAALCASADERQMHEWLEQVHQELVAFSVQQGQGGGDFALAVVPRGEHLSASSILSSADGALHQAWQNHPHLFMAKAKGSEAPSQENWRDAVNEAIEHQKFGVMRQEVMALEGGKKLQLEWFATLSLAGRQYSAGAFLAFVDQFNLGQAMDLAIFNNLLSRGLFHNNLLNVVNLTLASVRDPDPLLASLDSYTHDFPLAFEISEEIALADPAAVKAFVEQLRIRGLGLGVDHVGRHIESLRYLHDLAPDHIKLDQSLACYGENEEVGREVIRALAKIGQSLKIQVIATRVEKGEQLAILQELGVHGYQGYLMPPTAVS
ncbi:bifunctional diguanylate cyclase/phosphodiesterase [Gallaecimonas mangrovi]|uniref:bifunctional diguanylate cyclase/phosphodiesterase n=1 Tax=Gallaecimonas mangrovi TaxID=2291597 RepID=UPI000E208555|nr:LapD/MoxY N-terminal periplasmic domain-containing protein [Gallaecimonas mangrovi]